MAEHKRKEWENQEEDGNSLGDGVTSDDEEWECKKLVLGGLGGGEETVSGLSREESSGDAEYFTGGWALYGGTEGTTHTVQIISVDSSLAPLSYVILLPDGTETTTEAANFQGVTEQPSRELVAGDVGDGVLGADGGAGFGAGSAAVHERGGLSRRSLEVLGLDTLVLVEEQGLGVRLL